MDTVFFIALFSLAANPIISLILVKATKPRPNWRKRLVHISTGILALIILALLTNISTSSGATDWAFLGLFHLAICVLLLVGASLENKITSIFSIALLVFVFGVSYLLSTIGILGLAFIMGEQEPSRSVRINNSTLLYQRLR